MNIIKVLGGVILVVALVYFLSPYFIQNASATNSNRVELGQYGSLEPDSLDRTFKRAFEDINGKTLIVPVLKANVGKLDIAGKSNFEIEFQKGGEINCEQLRLIDCKNFSFHGLNLKGTVQRPTRFDVIGDCSDFSIFDCNFASEKDAQGKYTFLGIHVRCDWDKPNRTYENSPRNFKIYGNTVRNASGDGILVHAHCRDFVIENNLVEDVKCIGIEVEGRFGGWKNTTVHPCKNAVIQNNTMNRCDDWGILLMWVDNVKVYDNVSKEARGSFLSVGCTNLEVKRNVLEGKLKGFEISQEFFKIDNGVNDNVVVEDNEIVGQPRDYGRATLDIRHAKNVRVNNNKIECLFKANSSCISVVSSRNIVVSNNTFTAKSGMPFRTILDEAVDPETGKKVRSLSVEKVDLRGNSYSGVKDDHSIKVERLERKKCYVK